MSNPAASERKLSELMGVSEGSVQWGKVGVFCLALVVAKIIGFLLHAQWTARIPAIPYAKLGFSLSAGEDSLLLVVLVLVAFRLLRQELAAAAAAAIVYGALRFVPLYIAAHAELAASITWQNAFWAFPFLVGLVLALRWVKPVWLALGLGAAAGYTTASCVVRWTVAGLHWPDAGQLLFHSIDLLTAVLFAAAFAGGLHLVGKGQARVSKWFFVGSYVGGLAVATVGLFLILIGAPNELIPLLSVAALIFSLYAAGAMMILVYQMWKAIQDGKVRTTAGKALGLLFVPFFNLYWVFQAFWGFAKDYNAYVDRHSPQLRKLPEGLFLAYAILAVASVIPFLFPVTFVVGLITIWRICDAVNALPAPQAGAAIAPPMAA